MLELRNGESVIEISKQQAREQVRRKTLGAAEAAGAMSSRLSKSNIAQVIRLLNNVDAAIREGAVKSLARIDSLEAQTAVLSANTDPDPRVRAAVCVAIGRMRLYESVEMLERSMLDRDEKVQIAAAAGLGLLGDYRGLDSVMRFANPKNPLRWEALRAINHITKNRFSINAPGLNDALKWVAKNKRKLMKKSKRAV